MLFEVIKLDRRLPLLKSLEDQNILIRGEFGASMSKERKAITIGDICEAQIPKNQKTAIISKINLRKSELIRKSPVDRGTPQALAANFDSVVICTSADNLNFKHILRAICIARNTQTKLTLLVTKTDLTSSFNNNLITIDEFCISSSLSDKNLYYFALKQFDDIFSSKVKNSNFALSKFKLQGDTSLARETCDVSQLFPKNTTTVLLGKSGVGKSSLINAVAGSSKTLVGEVREKDNKGRHTTVSREIIN